MRRRGRKGRSNDDDNVPAPSDTSATLTKKFLLYEKLGLVSAFVIQAADGEEALVYYAEEAWGYLKHADGSYYREEAHEDLDAVLRHYQIMVDEDGCVVERSGVRYPTLDDAFREYRVSLQPDGTYLSLGIKYDSVFQLLDEVFPEARFEIQDFVLDEFDRVQSFHLSYDDMTYWEESSEQVISNVIAGEHRHQADRYESIGNVEGAIEELKKALNLGSSRRKIAAYERIGYLYGSVNQWKLAETYYQQAWDESILLDNQAQFAERLGNAFEKQSDLVNALKYYELSVELDLPYVEPGDLNFEKLVDHINEIKSRV